MSKQSQVVRDHVRTFRKSGRDSLSEYLQQELGWNADNAASAIAEAGFDDSGMVLGDTLRTCEQQLVDGTATSVLGPSDEIKTCQMTNNPMAQDQLRATASMAQQPWNGGTDEEIFAPVPPRGPDTRASVGVDKGGVPYVDPGEKLRDGAATLSGPMGMGAGAYLAGRAAGQDSDAAMKTAKVWNAVGAVTAAAGRGYAKGTGRGPTGTGPVGGSAEVPPWESLNPQPISTE